MAGRQSSSGLAASMGKGTREPLGSTPSDGREVINTVFFNRRSMRKVFTSGHHSRCPSICDFRPATA